MAVKVKENETVMTTAQAADYLGLAEDTVRKYIDRGLIKATKLGPINIVTKSECDRYRREKRPRGNPNLMRQGA